MRRLLAILALLFIAACAPAEPSDSPENAQSYRTGSQGIEVKFIENLPPSTIYDEEGAEEYRISLEIANRGAHTVSREDIKFYLSGFDENIITEVTDASRQGAAPSSVAQIIEDTLDGKGFGIPEGDIGIVEFVGKVDDLNEKDIERYEATLHATACYEYVTIASEQICLDPEPFAPGQKTCTPQTLSLGTQGAPIAVTSLDLEARPKKTRININIRNSGSGDVFRGVLDMCSPYATQGLGLSELDKIKVKVSVSGEDITQSCRPLDNQQEIRLIDGSTNIICEVDVEGSSAYEAPLTVELLYGYRSVVKKPITILPDFGP